MATIDDLPNPKFSELSDDQLMELIKERRKKRAAPDEEIKAATVKKAVAREKRGKATSLKTPKQLVGGISSADAESLLAQLLAMRGEDQ